MTLKKLETLQASLEKYSKKKVEHLLGKDRLQDTYNESADESTIQDREKAEGSTDRWEKKQSQRMSILPFLPYYDKSKSVPN